MRNDVAPKSGGKRLKVPAVTPDTDGPQISIVTIVLNAAKSLEATIRSVIEQGNGNVEYIVQDGGSTDETLDIIRKYENSIDYWVSLPDNGIYDAMNKAVRLACGRWVCFLGADDTLRSNLKTVGAYLENEQTIYYGDVLMTGSGKIYDGPFGISKLLSRNICQQSIFYPRSLFDSQQFSMKYPILADWEFNLRCYSRPNVSFQYIPVVVANYDDTNGMSSIRSDERFNRDRGKIIRKYLPLRYYIWFRIKRIVRTVIGPSKGRA